MSKNAYILGISAYYHDSAAALLCDGVIMAAAQEERFTRKRHDHEFPRNAVDFCLKQAGISSAEISAVAFYEKPWIKFERLLETYVAFAPQGISSFLMAMPQWLKKKLWLGNEIKELLEFSGEIIFPEHHQSHAASAFYPSPFERAAILTIDGVGEWATASWGSGDGGTLVLEEELRFPHSLGLLYSAFTYYTGFKVNSGEYKVMGLAPYGKPRFVQAIYDNLLDLREDGSFRLNMKYFNYCQGLTMTSRAFDQLFAGPPRQPESALTQREMDLAASVQVVTEEIMLRMARYVRRQTGLTKLCLAGGVALNCVANGKILKEAIFEDIWIQPAAGDAGGALGAAYFAWHQVLGNSRSTKGKGDAQFGSYLGPRYDNDEIRQWLEKNSIPFLPCSEEEVLEVTARALAAGKIVGWFQGAMEFGPRALGARSILGDPRDPTMQAKMNLKIKFRESFRPFAPSVKRDKMEQYFDLDYDSPYMLFVAPVRSERCLPPKSEDQALFGIEKLNVPRSDIPAVTHLDYSARIQTVDAPVHQRYYRLLDKFEELTGCAVLVNTSFNVRGEPIVCTPEDAFRCFMRTEIDLLVLENCVLRKEQQSTLHESGNWQAEFVLD